MFYFEQKNYREISMVTSFSLKQVKSYLQNGKRNLKKIIIEEYDRLLIESDRHMNHNISEDE